MRSIDRRQLLVVVVALMCLTALPGASSAAGGGDVRMPSNHTDFGTGDEPPPEVLENFSVGGSGDSASLSGPVGGTTKGGGLVSSGDTISWSESSPSTSDSVINVTGVTNTQSRTISGSDSSGSDSRSITVGGSVDPSGPASGSPEISVTSSAADSVDAFSGSTSLGFGDTKTASIDAETSQIMITATTNEGGKTSDAEVRADGNVIASEIVFDGSESTESITISEQYVSNVTVEVTGTGYDAGADPPTLDISSIAFEPTSSPSNIQIDADGGGGTASLGTGGTAQLDLTTDTSTITTSHDGYGSISWNLSLTEISKTRDPVVELNGDSSQQISIDGSVADGQTVTTEIDNSWLESAENTATVTLNDSGLDADDPPMEAKVSVEKPAQSARYVSAAYDNLSRSNGVGVDWSGSGTLDVTVQGWTGSSWEDARHLSTSETGDVVLNYEPIEYGKTRVEIVANDNVETREESIQFFTSTPEIESATPSSGDAVSESPVELSINVSDADFGTVQGDSVDVTFYDAAGDSQIGTDTVTGNGTATTNWGTLEGGNNSWYAVATDSYGNEVTSQTFTFNAPSTLRLLNESDPDQLVTTNSEVEVTFFSGEQVITRTTTDGTVDLTGLPADETFTVQVEANGYVTRQAVIQGIVEQQNIYLLPESVESVATRFTIDDPTGQFATSNTRIAVKKPITKNGSTEYEIVASDIAGEGGYATILQQDQRYLLEVTNTETGNTRSLGPYVATEAQTVNLRIEALDFQFGSNEAGYQWDAAYENETEPAISFDWKTTTATAQTLDVTIRERGGDGTVIFDESYVEPEQVSELALIGDSVENPQATTWLVEWEATLADGNTVSGSAVAGPSKLPVEMPNVPDQVVSVLSILIILLVAGLFSAANVTVGAIVTSLTAGGLWFVGATPGAVTGGLVSLALFVAVIAHLRTNQQISPR